MELRPSVLKKRAAYRECFSTPQGREVLKDLYKVCRVTDTTHVPCESHETAFNEGMRRVFNHIFGLMHPKKEATAERLEEIRDE